MATWPSRPPSAARGPFSLTLRRLSARPLPGPRDRLLEREVAEQLSALLDVVTTARVVLHQEPDRARHAEALGQGFPAFRPDRVVRQARRPTHAALPRRRAPGVTTWVRNASPSRAASLSSASSQVTNQRAPARSANATWSASSGRSPCAARAAD